MSFDIHALFDAFLDPISGNKLSQTVKIDALSINQGIVRGLIIAPKESISLYQDFIDTVIKPSLMKHEDIKDVRLALTNATNESMPASPQPKRATLSTKALNDTKTQAPVAEKRPDHVKRVIVVASGKGGVGKSTMTLHLALAFKKLGLKVGIMDADIYGPSFPTLLGVSEKPALDDEKRMIPHKVMGLKSNSIGYIVDTDQALIWRGPMATQALHQLLLQTKWGSFFSPLDLLIIDMPPGTGDIHLSLSQKTIIDGAIIVSTPQEMALADARRALKLYEKTNIPVLGIVENMAYFQSPDGSICEIFGRGGAKDLSAQEKIPFLGEIPIDSELRAKTDEAKADQISAIIFERFSLMAKSLKQELKL